MSKLQYHRESNGIVTVTLHRPDVHNAFDDVLILLLQSLFDLLIDVHDDALLKLTVI